MDAADEQWPVWLRPDGAGGSELAVHAQPGARTSAWAGTHGDAMKIRVAARAVEGAANEALAGFLAERLGVPRRAVRLLRGEKSRRKTFSIALPPAAIARIILSEACAPDS